MAGHARRRLRASACPLIVCESRGDKPTIHSPQRDPLENSGLSGADHDLAGLVSQTGAGVIA
jgi:hypothetical protein